MHVHGWGVGAVFVLVVLMVVHAVCKKPLKVRIIMKSKRMLIISDLHCGHRVGLTPEKYWSDLCGEQYYKIQQETWKKYTEIIKSLGKVDILICNGDAIDGKGRRSAGTENIANAMNTQIEMAVECIRAVQTKKILMTYGTTYHTGEEDCELIIANEVGADIRSHQFFEVNGVKFDVRHKPTGGNKLPHTKPAATGRDWLSNLIWSLDGEQPRADVTIRSHVHSHDGCFKVGWLGMTTPALQGQGSKYGSRECGGKVDWGVVVFDIFENGAYIWKAHIVIMESQRQELRKL
jgi:hypothetical protein